MAGVLRFSRAVAVALLLILSSSGRVSSEPDSAVLQLMQEPVSLFDFGLQGLRNRLRNLSIAKDVSTDPGVFYEWNENRVVIFIFPAGATAPDLDSAKEWARRAVDGVRSCLGVNPKTGELIGAFVIKDLFSHSGFRKESDPTDLGTCLAAITCIQFSIAYGPGDEIPQFLEGQANLVDTNVLFGK